MRRCPSLLLPLLALALAVPSAAPAQTPREVTPPSPGGAGGTPVAPTPTPPSTAVTVPKGKPLYLEGQDGRFLMDGPWMFRLDDANVGLSQRFYAQTATAGWSGATVPSVWNAADGNSANNDGSIAWYRKDFRLPDRSRALNWIVRFEGVNFGATVWLNGRKLGEHLGGYTPFELDLANVARNGVNRLVVRVDNRRKQSAAAGGAALEGVPLPPRGWWNYGGMQREVYLRRVDRVDVGEVHVQTRLPKPRGAATVVTSAVVRNTTRAAQRVQLRGKFGSQSFDLGTQTIAARQRATFRGTIVVRRPKLWSPARPGLYTVRLSATAAQGGAMPTAAGGYTLRTGIRSLVVSSRGELLLNGAVVHFRGAALHEDALTKGSALDNATRAKLIGITKAVGATFVRAHYPMHPQFQELADREGILVWSEIPSTYQLSDANLGRRAFRALAFQELREDVIANRNHPSVAVWSLGNEMASKVGRNQASYLTAGAKLVRELDPTRPVGLAFAGHPETPCQAAYRPIDFLGMNDYFGWYTGHAGNIADRDNLPAFLDDLRRCYPRKALAVTEFGAEANRDGPVEEKGTYEFQREFIQYHLDVFDSKPWLTGSVYWALQEFRIGPGWGGGNPWGEPPLHQKGVVRLDWTRKPAFDVLRSGYAKVRQYVPRRARK